MRKKIIYMMMLSCIFLFNACKKGEPIPERSFASITVSSKAMLDVPAVLVYVDDELIDTVSGGGSGAKLISRDKETKTLYIKDLETGKVLLDSVFTVKAKNNFTVLVDKTLGIATFYSAAETVVPADSVSVQLFYNADFGGLTGRKLTFKIFATYDGENSFVATPYEVKGLESGTLSEPLLMSYNKDASGVLPTYCVQTLDAETGDVVMELYTGFWGYGMLMIEPGKNYVNNVKAAGDPTNGYFYDIFQYFQL